MRFTRDFYRPKDARIEYPDGLPGAEIHRYENGSRAPDSDVPFAAVFGGKRTKPDWHYRFRTDEQREAKIEAWIENQKANIKDAAERRKAHNGGHSLKVGDVLHGGWGYDQTNASFYQIVGVPSKCFVIAREIGSKIVNGDGGPTTYVVPVKDSFLSDDRGGAPKRYKAGPDNSITIESFLHPSKTSWDSQHYETGWGYGH